MLARQSCASHGSYDPETLRAAISDPARYSFDCDQFFDVV
jgi:hypothetical protein